MTSQRIELGKWGEDLAFRELKRLGYKNIIRNYRCSVGEVDMVAMDAGTLVFIEVKTRKGACVAYAKEAVTGKKRRQLSKLALTYIKDRGLDNISARFDVVAISIEGDKVKTEIIKNAFDLAF